MGSGRIGGVEGGCLFGGLKKPIAVEVERIIGQGAIAMKLFGRSSEDRRRHERVSLLGTATMLGDVLDLSESGARLFCKGTVGCELDQEMGLEIAQATTSLKVDVRVVRIAELGFKRYEVGLEFVSLNDEQLATIRALQQPGISEQVCPRAYLAA